ncbi:MAG: type II 3-dehydroquinate dehydratase [Defluviitaleaceae bacterium]|nr:type II 3-dehydroquinate dehydratase [Defluviitaleaceae bacterium]
MKLIVINGPNINMLGIREPNLYGNADYNTLEEIVRETCTAENIEVELFQSNHEGAIVDKIQQALTRFNGIVINPAAYTHTSIAILDALKAVALPTVEVHISDLSTREDFRQISYAGQACIKTITGQGIDGYRQAILFLKEHLQKG